MLNMDFNKRVVRYSFRQPWIASNQSGVCRKLLESEEDERGHTTSIVRIEPGAIFTSHGHPMGEEVLVLDGTFSDETGDYSNGTYFRNPDGFHHQPFSKEGCTILVKLHQFQSDDEQHIKIDTNITDWRSGNGGLKILPLHSHNSESVALVKWPEGEYFKLHTHYGGEEIYVISGELIDEHGRYPAGTWIRSPHLSQHFPYVEQETLIWVKTGHLL